MSSAVEVKVVFREGDNQTRILRGILSGEDETFIHLKRRDGLFLISKNSIVLIETPASGEAGWDEP
jgi:hypothetical protein